MATHGMVTDGTADSIQHPPNGDDQGGDVCPACKATREWWKLNHPDAFSGQSGPWCNSCNSTGKLSVAVTRRLTGEYDPNSDLPF